MHSGKSTVHFIYVNEWLTVVWGARTNGLWNALATNSGVAWENFTIALIV